MPGRNILLIPGPTTVPRRIQVAMNIEQEYLPNTRQEFTRQDDRLAA